MNNLVIDPRLIRNDQLSMAFLPSKIRKEEKISVYSGGNVEPEPIINDLEEEEITLDFIINEKPKAKIVREYMRINLEAIKSEEDIIFGK